MGRSRRGGAPDRLRRGGGLPLAVALATASNRLTACSDEPSTTPAAAPTSPAPSSTAPTPSSTDPAEPDASVTPEPPRRPRSQNTTKGRKEFADFVVRRGSHALASNDAEAVTGLAPKGATRQGCRELRAELTRRKQQGWFVDFPGAEVKRIEVAPGDPPGVWVATARISLPESRSYFDDGSHRNDHKAHPNVDFTVRMRHQAGRFVLMAFSVG